MTNKPLPLPQDLMLPTLRAAVELGGVSRYRDIDERALELAGITPEQRAVVFDETATATGPKVLHRIAWARTMLKSIGALEGAGYGQWAPTALGVELAEMGDAQAKSHIGELLSKAFETVEPSPDQLAEFRDMAAHGKPASMPARDLIELWGAHRRRSGVIERVRKLFETNGLTTEPDFELGSLDTMIKIVAAKPTPSGEQAEPGDKQGSPGTGSTVTLVVGNIPSATGGIAAVSPQDDLLTAQSEMQARDYSQLAVMTGPYKVVGAISWESIAKARNFKPDATLPDCIDTSARVVTVDRPLLDTVPDISSAGFVFTKNAHNEVTGIVTVADLADQFAALTRPFLLIGEIERVLRRAIDRCFSIEYLFEALDPDDDREVEGAQSLTLGEVQRLLESPAGFELLGWIADRKVFVRGLDTVRSIRNDVMHFSPDPPDGDDVRRLAAFSHWIAAIEAQAATS